MDDENVSGSARTKRGIELILFYMRNADAWRHDSIYRSIKKISKQKVKHLSLQKALKYTICRKKFEILSMLDSPAECDDDDTDESESDNDDVFESDNDGYEILKKLAPTVTDRESESDNDESDDEGNSKSETSMSIKKRLQSHNTRGLSIV